MTPYQAAYRAGQIVCEIEGAFALTAGAMGNASRMPNRLPVVLRHVWAKAAKVPDVAALLEDFDPPAALYADAEQGGFWMGYYGQKVARGLPAGFGDRLKALREKAVLSVAALAEAAGVSRESVRLYEVGERRPTWDAVQALAAALNVPTDTFRA